MKYFVWPVRLAYAVLHGFMYHKSEVFYLHHHITENCWCNYAVVETNDDSTAIHALQSRVWVVIFSRFLKEVSFAAVI